MPDWPLQESLRAEFWPDRPNPFTGTVVTGSGTTQVMGAYAAIGWAPFGCAGILILIRNHSSATDYLVDVAIGAAGSEQIIIPLLLTSGPTSSNRTKQFFFPLRIPSGTRVAARCQNLTISSTLAMAVTFMAESFKGVPSLERITSYGLVASTSSGTAQAAPGANAWGAWTVITPPGGTVDDHVWIMPIYSDQDLATRTAQSHVMDIAIGAAGSERRLVPPLFFHASSTALQMTYFPGYWITVPAGSVLSARYSAVAATNLGLDVAIYAGSK
jgi:hypothetical protein